MSDIRDFTGKNRKFTGTTGIKLPTGTEAQRVNETGQIRFNSDNALAEYYDGTLWKAIDSPPSVDTVSPQTPVDDGSTVTEITITGTNFQSGLTLDLIGNDNTVYNVSSYTVVSSTSLTFNYTSALAAAGVNTPYSIRVTNPTSLSGTLTGGFTPNTGPIFNTASGSLGSINIGANGSTFTQISVTDTSGGVLVYSIVNGALPDGVSINSSTGALSGTTTNAGTFGFTVQVTDGTTAVTRDFNATVLNPYIQATGGTITTSGDYKIHTFTGSDCFTVSAAPTAPLAIVDYVVVAGGGGGGYHYGGAGGAGGYRESHNASTSGCYTASPLATPTSMPVTTTTYPITVGGGGNSNPAASPWRGCNGANSVFSTITSTGGGGGGGQNGGSQPGYPGGSGGGAGGNSTGGSGGSGNSPPTSPPQGNPGAPDGTPNQGTGSGGAGGSGSGKNGGSGVGTAINPAAGQPGPNGALRYFAGGANGGPPAGEAAPAGGRQYGQGGVANSGQGAGGDTPGGGGGSGVVIIRYKYQ